MLELVKAGGWLMLPIIACSIVAMAIIAERFWTLRTQRVIPRQLVAKAWQLHRNNQLTKETLARLRDSSPLGRILAAGLINRHHSREVMKESITDVGRQVVFELERYLNTLGTIASIAPLLGLLGTVIGMIQVFSVIMSAGVGEAGLMAGGISKALITTAAGLAVAIPSLIFHRYFNGRVDRLVLGMEEEALKMVEIMHGERERDDQVHAQAPAAPAPVQAQAPRAANGAAAQGHASSTAANQPQPSRAQAAKPGAAPRAPS